MAVEELIHRPSLLIVEDEVVTAIDLKSKLEDIGYEVVGMVTSGTDAIVMAESESPDIVLMDIVIDGEMDGIEAAKEIRERFGIPIIFITAYANENRFRLAQVAEPFGYILKPFSIREIKVTIEMAYYKAQLDKEKRAASDALKKSENRYRSILETLVEVYFENDLDGNFTFVSPSVTEMTGYQPEELIGVNYRKLLDENRGDIIYSAAAPVISTGIPAKVVPLEIIGKDGNKVFVELSFSLLKNADGENAGIYGLMRDVSEKRQREEALQISEERYRLLAERMTDVIWAVDKDLKYSYISPSVERLTGFVPEEAVGQPLIDSYSGDFKSQMEKELGALSDLAKSDTIVDWGAIQLNPRAEQVLSRDGTIIDVETQANIMHDNGKFTGLIGVTRDITDRKKAEDALQENMSRFQLLFDSSPISLWENDWSKVKECVNDLKEKGVENFTEFFETHPDELDRCFTKVRGLNINKATLEMYGTDDFAKFINHISLKTSDIGIKAIFLEELLALIDGNLPFRGHSQHTTISGELRYTYVQLNVAPGYEQDWGKVLVSVQDITELKQVEKELEEGQRSLNIAQDTADIGSWEWNIEEDILTWSDKTFRQHGMEPGEATPSFKLLEQFFHPDERETASKNIRDALRRKEPFSVNIKMITRQGKEWIVHTQGLVERNENGEPIRYVGTQQNVTSQVQAEAQLRQSQKLEALGTLTGGIAHDFNNILASIIGFTELSIMDLPNDHSSKGNLAEVLKAGQRAKSLIQQMLSFARPTPQDKRPVRIGSSVSETLNFLRATLPATIEIKKDIRAKSDIVLADQSQIHQVLMNLCTNAGQAMGQTGGVLTISLDNIELSQSQAAYYPELSEGKFLIITVSDTGPGIDKELLDRIFEPFFTTKGQGEGTGMGLAVVHGIVKNHDGAVYVKSEKSKGTDFEVYFPVFETEIEPRPKTEPKVESKGSERVLFVDDEPSIANLGKRILGKLGYKVTSLTSSTEALDLFKSRADDFDLIITDMTMPDLTGLDFAREIIQIRPEMPIILCTGYSSHITPEKIQAAGITKMLMKPLTVEEVARVVRDVLDQQD